MSTEKLQAAHKAITEVAAALAQRKTLAAFATFDNATHIGHRQFARACAKADEDTRLLAVKLSNALNAIRATPAVPAEPARQVRNLLDRAEANLRELNAWDHGLYQVPAAGVKELILNLRAVLAAEPAGWRLVPIEATREMLCAWRDAEGSDEYYSSGRGIGHCYRKMLAAAPEPALEQPAADSAHQRG